MSAGPPPDAAVFDLDGVVTFTARIHFASWKASFDECLRAQAEAEDRPFRAFTEADYRTYVDGRPRMDGVRTFLAARGIELPDGEPSDPPGCGTVHALAARKNGIFRERVRRDGVDVDPDAVRLARDLREAGVRVGVASSSKNTALILETAGIEDLFEARVDGVASERLGLAGKPAPDIFLACLERLDVPDPGRAVVVEDAVAGVEAGRAGGFGLVLGVDRDGSAVALREGGADWVVRGFRDVMVDRLRAWFGNRAHARPNALAHWHRLAATLDGRTPAVFLDYDGTLTPIVDRPELATLSDDMRETLRRLASTWPTTIVSGRGREDVQSLVGIDDVNYAGSHGFDIAGSEAGGRVRLEVAEEFVHAIAEAGEEIRERTRGVPGVLVEDKTYAVAVHWRLVPEGGIAEVERAVDAALARRPELRKTLGKKVFELRPAIDWDKGRAVLWLLEALGLDGPRICPLYIGDDVTDEDAFRALENRGVGVVVAELPHPTAARWSLQDVPEVRVLLGRLADLRGGRGTAPNEGGPMNARPFQHQEARAAVPGADPWVLAYDGFDPDREGLREALCALGNGHFVTRGAAEEARADDVHYAGTYVAGGYDRLASEVAGRTVVNEDLVNFPNWLPLTFRPEDGDWLDLRDVEILAYRQELRLRDGVLVRRFRIRDAAGRETRVESRRLVSLAYPHLAVIDYRITPENWAGDVRIRSGLDGSVRNTGVARYRQLANRHIQVVGRGRVVPEGIYLIARTAQSRFEVGEAARTRVSTGTDGWTPARPGDADTTAQRRIVDEEADRIAEEVRVRAGRGETIRVEKVVALFASHDRGIGEPGREARLAVRVAGDSDRILARHRNAWHALWRRYDVEIGDDPGFGTARAGPDRTGAGDDIADGLTRTQLILRLHIFHLLQTVSPHTVGLDVGAPARGLHGEAYRGHIFWDELFALPFYNLRQPSITRSLLLYRYYRLDAARELAREAGYEGAMYPWQSGHDGREATQQLHLNPLSGEWGPDWSRLQRHVNAAITYNVWRYWRATGDREFLRDYGAEIVLEIARFWASIATWNQARERYEIVGVIGPDEYHEQYPGAEVGGLDNNAYTNVMASWCLRRALDVLDEVGRSRRAELVAMLELREDELRRWSEVADRMFVPFVDDGVIEQFEGYAGLEPFDWAGYRERYGNIKRLDRILKAEGDTPDRYQVSKQADATMLFYLFEPDEVEEMLARMGYEFDREAMARTIDYYRDRTSHGSTLSKTVFASVVHHLDCDEGCQLFLEALRSDVEDVQGDTTPEGIHLGAMAGTVAIVLRRYLGVEFTADGVNLELEMPSRLHRIQCRVHWRGRWLDIELTHSTLRLTADRDRPEPVPVRIDGEWLEVEPGEALETQL